MKYEKKKSKRRKDHTPCSS